MPISPLYYVPPYITELPPRCGGRCFLSAHAAWSREIPHRVHANLVSPHPEFKRSLVCTRRVERLDSPIPHHRDCIIQGTPPSVCTLFKSKPPFPPPLWRGGFATRALPSPLERSLCPLVVVTSCIMRYITSYVCLCRRVSVLCLSVKLVSISSAFSAFAMRDSPGGTAMVL